MLYNLVLEKIAAMTSPGDLQVKQERALIERVQKYNDMIAMSQLVQLYRGTLDRVIKESGLERTSGRETAQQIALAEFKRIIKDKFDLNNKKAKPNSYIYGTLLLSLKNHENDMRSGAVKIPQKIARQKKLVDIAKNYLSRELDREPSSSEIISFVRNEMKEGKDLNKQSLKAIEKYDIKEWSGGRIIGRDGGAETMTYEDLSSSTKQKPMDIFNQQNEEQIVLSEIRKFTTKLTEQRFLEQVYGLGMYRGRRYSVNKASIENGVPNGKRFLEKFRKFLEKRGVL